LPTAKNCREAKKLSVPLSGAGLAAVPQLAGSSGLLAHGCAEALDELAQARTGVQHLALDRNFGARLQRQTDGQDQRRAESMQPGSGARARGAFSLCHGLYRN
jgi:hypothetical protein